MKFKNNKIACFILSFLYDGITKFCSIKIGKNKNSSHFQVPQNILSIESILLKSSPESLYEPSIQSLTCIVKIATISLQLSFKTFDFPSNSCPKIDCTKLQLAESCISQEKELNLKALQTFLISDTSSCIIIRVTTLWPSSPQLRYKYHPWITHKVTWQKEIITN